MGNNLTCGGDTHHPPPDCVRAVAVRPGLYAEGFLRCDEVERSVPGGVVAVATQDSMLLRVTDTGSSIKSGVSEVVNVPISAGDKFLILEGKDAGGASALRFGLGDRVLCKTGGEPEWQGGTVTGYWYYELGWCQLAPYQIRLDGDVPAHIFAPADDPALVRPYSTGRGPCGPGWAGGEDEQTDAATLQEGDRVVFTGGGRFAGDIQVLADWTLKVGMVGRVLRYHGECRHRGVWPVDVAFPGNHCDVPIPLTQRDIRRADECEGGGKRLPVR